MKNFWIVAIFGFIALSSCDHEYAYTYEVTNQVDEEILVILFSEWYDSTNTYTIKKNETQILFITSHGFEGPDGPYFTDVKQDLDSLSVIKNDSIFSKINYLENSSWSYHDGLYKAVVRPEDFE